MHRDGWRYSQGCSWNGSLGGPGGASPEAPSTEKKLVLVWAPRRAQCAAIQPAAQDLGGGAGVLLLWQWGVSPEDHLGGHLVSRESWHRVIPKLSVPARVLSSWHIHPPWEECRVAQPLGKTGHSLQS